jgi:GTPase
VIVPFSQGRARAMLFEAGVVLSETVGDEGYAVQVRWNARQKAGWLARDA